MNNFLVLTFIFIITGCSSIGRTDSSLKVLQVGSEFKVKPIKLSFNGKYIKQSGILKSEAKKRRKKQLLLAVENALHAVFNLGSIHPIYQGRFPKDFIEKMASEAFGSKDIYKKLAYGHYVPTESITFSNVLNNNEFRFIPYSEDVAFHCAYDTNKMCQGRPATLIYSVGKKRSLMQIGAIGYSSDKLALPSYNIHKSHSDYIYTGKIKDAFNLENKFLKKHQYLQVSKSYQNILSNKFSNCRRKQNNEELDLETCLSKNMPPSVYVSRMRMNQKQLHEKLALDEHFRFSYWGALYLLNTSVNVKRINKEEFKIELIINTPYLYKKIQKVSDYLE